jgi:hypothetical protein
MPSVFAVFRLMAAPMRSGLMSQLGQTEKWPRIRRESALLRILLQKSKVASVRIFGETLKREAIDDSDSLSRVTEVAHEFSLRR